MSAPLIVSAPGKVILTGEHAVVYGKTAIATSVGLRCFVILQQTSDEAVTLNLPDLVPESSLKKEWSKEDILCALNKRKQPGCTETTKMQVLRELFSVEEEKLPFILELAVLVFLHLLLAIYDDGLRDLTGLTVTVLSDLPAGAGLGSSAAYSVGLSAAFLVGSGKFPSPSKTVSHDIDMRQEIVDVIKTTGSDASEGSQLAGRSWGQEHLDIINMWGLEAEKLVHGTPSGIDNTISTNGGTISFQSNVMKPLKNTSTIRILIVNTGVPRSTKKMVAGVRERHDKFPSVVVPALESIDALSKEVQRLLEHSDSGPSQMKSLEELVQFNQHLLDALGVGHAAISEVCALAKSVGLSAKLTGGGGGGCVIVLIPQDMTAGQVKELQSTFEHAGFESWETTIGSSGVQVHQGKSVIN